MSGRPMPQTKTYAEIHTMVWIALVLLAPCLSGTLR